MSLESLIGQDVLDDVQVAGEWLHIAAESRLTSEIRFSDWTSLTEALDRIEFAHWCKCQPVYVNGTLVDGTLCALCQWEMWLDSVPLNVCPDCNTDCAGGCCPRPQHSCSDDRWCPEFGCRACDEQADTDADKARMYNGF